MSPPLSFRVTRWCTSDLRHSQSTILYGCSNVKDVYTQTTHTRSRTHKHTQTQVYNTDLSPTRARVARWRSGKAGNYQSSERRSASCKAVVALTIAPSIDCYRRQELCSLDDDDDDDADVILEVAKGNGPVDALARALNRALVPSFPTLKDVSLTDYKVRILDADRATAASVRVMVDFRYTQMTQTPSPGGGDHDDTRTREVCNWRRCSCVARMPLWHAIVYCIRADLSCLVHAQRKRISWTTVSAGPNIIAASLAALVDGYEYHLAEHVDHKYI